MQALTKRLSGLSFTTVSRSSATIRLPEGITSDLAEKVSPEAGCKFFLENKLKSRGDMIRTCDFCVPNASKPTIPVAFNCIDYGISALGSTGLHALAVAFAVLL